MHEKTNLPVDVYAIDLSADADLSNIGNFLDTIDVINADSDVTHL